MLRRALLIIIALSFVPSSAAAFCGFYVSGGGADLYNEATQVVLMRNGQKTALSMQNNYQGPTEDFAMVIPVPVILQEENVKTLEKNVFDKVDKLSAPRLVEYWERDPCMQNLGYGDGFGNFGSLGMGGLGMRGSGRGGGGAVIVEAEFSVGEYDIVILSAREATALENWLKDNKYKIPDGAEPYFRPYIERGQYFFVAKVNSQKVKFEDGKAVLSPLRFHYDTEEFSLPIRLGMINSTGKQDLLVYILAQNQRYETANYDNVTIPTNIEVNPRVKDDFAGFYEALFSKTVEENPKSVVTEYSWGAAKCDPCPTGVVGGATMSATDLQTFGGDVIGANWRNPWSGWVLTRLHARYQPDDIGEDLVFKKADPIMGGREVRDADGAIEKGFTTGSTNNFQGRYIIRNEWEGEVKCDEPERGIWGGPPNAYGMTLVAETVLLQMRRSKLSGDQMPSDEELLAAPKTVEEREAIAYHLRRKFGYSEAPSSGGMPTATSPNTRGGGIATAPATLGAFLREPVPELKAEPDESAAKQLDEAAAAAAPKPAPAAEGDAGEPDTISADDSKPAAMKAQGCATGGRSGALSYLAFLALLIGIRRRR